MEKSDRLFHVTSQLQRVAVKKVVGQSTFVLCPYHSERTPSFRIWHSAASKYPGYGKCYGCQEEGKQWDEFAELIGCEPFDDKLRQRYAVAPQVLSLEEEDEVETFKFKPLPKGKTWRGISTDLLRKTSCRFAKDKYNRTFIHMPIRVGGNEKGYIKARLKKREGAPSFINSKGSWAKTYGYFPFDFAVKMAKKKKKTIILVEGQRDALRLLSMGLPAVSIMGTNSWSDYKVDLLEMYGIERVIILMDGDSPGRAASKTAREFLEGKLPYVEVKLWAFKDGPYKQYLADPNRKANKDEWKKKFWDPFNCPKRILEEIRERYF